jgi:cold shock CspA family protein/ribosome-associated translation inhibitor RaiA
MQTPVEIEFLGLHPSEAMRSLVLKQIGALEKRFGRITSGRVVIRAPSDRQRRRGVYEITIHLSLPRGSEVNVARSRSPDETHADVTVTINDAFRRARRRLEDHARRMRGTEKTHDGPPVATVRTIDEAGGFGFLETADGRDIYFHRNSVLSDGFSRLSPGARVTFFEEMGEKGPQASTVRLLGKHGLR